MKKKKSAIIFCLILLFFSFLILSFPRYAFSQVGLLEKIAISKEANTLEVRILFNRYTDSSDFKLTQPNRIVIDFSGIENIRSSRHIDVNDCGVNSIRTGMFKRDTARVVFDLEDEFPPYKIERIEGGWRVLFWGKEEAEAEKEEIISEKVELQEAISHLEVNPARAKVNDSIVVDMSGSQNAESMEIEVFDSEGTRVASQKLSPGSARWEIKLEKPGEFVFKGKAFNAERKPSENLCETIIYINFPPTCKPETLYYEDYVGKAFIIDVSGSTDPDGEIVKADFVALDEKKNLVSKFTSTKKPFIWKKEFDREGIYTIPVVVTDNAGAVSQPSEVQVVVTRKKVFLLVEAGSLFARGSPYGGYAVGRMGILYNIVPGTLDFMISGGGGQAMISDPWKSFLTASMLFHVRFKPFFLGVGSGITSRISEVRNPDGEIITDFGFELTGKNMSRRSFYFEVRTPIGKDRSFADHHKIMAGFRFIF
ncbi:MAG: AMIN domain-containing protein [Candidatus Aminicenantes bacterium]|nr:AMIN domain-containing protein [Candidatus Aminicenantes bacterium]